MAVSLLLCSRGGAEDPASPRRPVPAGPGHQGSPRCKSISRGDAEPRSAKTLRCRVDASLPVPNDVLELWMERTGVWCELLDPTSSSPPAPRLRVKPPVAQAVLRIRSVSV